MKTLFKVLLLIIMPGLVFGQSDVKIMSYNLLNYPGSNSAQRNPYYKTILEANNPDVLVVQEIISLAGVNELLSDVLNSFGEIYTAGVFDDGPDSDNAIFFKPAKFNFVSNTPIATALRNINEFKLVNIISGDTLRIYSVHLKASSGSENEILRAAEVDSLRKVTNKLPAGKNFIVVGDYNIYNSNEQAYQKLLINNVSDDGNFNDPITMTFTSNWNNSANAPYHTQSTRVRQFGGGATGGLDDRFDLILMSNALIESGGVTYSPGTYTNIGNDGNHYNDSINAMPNTAVSEAVANALHYASDHLPISAVFTFENVVPVELAYFICRGNGDGVELEWQTATEVNSYGFEIERKYKNGDWKNIGFVKGAGNSYAYKNYNYKDNSLKIGGVYCYRLKQIDLNGSYKYYDEIEYESKLPTKHLLLQNYPNPFNPATSIRFLIVNRAVVTLKIYDTLGKLVRTLIDEEREAGEYEYVFRTESLASGIYVTQLNVDDEVMNRKIILIK